MWDPRIGGVRALRLMNKRRAAEGVGLSQSTWVEGGSAGPQHSSRLAGNRVRLGGISLVLKGRVVGLDSGNRGHQRAG